MGRFVFLSGPSCVGKGPVLRAVQRLYPSLATKLKKVVIYNDRKPRPGEINGVDYHFLSSEEIKTFPKEHYIVIEIRPGNLQALRLQDVKEVIAVESIGFLEAFHKFGAEIRSNRALASLLKDIKPVFLSPLSKEEIEFLKNEGIDLQKFITDIMRRKLLRRVQKQKGIPSIEDLKDVEKRANTAYEEMRSASQYAYVLPNHDGEDSDNWEQFYYPIGDARKTLLSFVEILEERVPSYYEEWLYDLLPKI